MTPLDIVFAYHDRTKHRFEGYAPSPESVDWATQPDPYRVFEGAEKVKLPLLANTLDTPYSALDSIETVEPKPFNLDNLAILLELSLALSAWKQFGSDRWALRCNPSSGNLHPTEATLLAKGINGLEDGVYHYLSRDHVLERRATCQPRTDNTQPKMFIGLSSIAWREAWKYGERGFRYCQLDVGHAIGGVRIAAASLGWRVRIVESVGTDGLARMLGLDREADFKGVEKEEADLLLEVFTSRASEGEAAGQQASAAGEAGIPPDFAPTPDSWKGTANLLDPKPMYDWVVIDEVSEATKAPDSLPPRSVPPTPSSLPPTLPPLSSIPAATLIRQRRSAQDFNPNHTMPSATFHRLLDSLLPRSNSAPLDIWPDIPRVHPVLFIHRVQGLPCGLYAFPRRPGILTALRMALNPGFEWTKPTGCPEHLPLYRLLALAPANCSKVARSVNCHQDIGADCAFAVGMLAEFETTLNGQPWNYRKLFWEAGLVGQTFYLEAESAGLKGTGVGCYFDDVFHEILGIKTRRFQSVYHFTVGVGVEDARIQSEGPYEGR